MEQNTTVYVVQKQTVIIREVERAEVKPSDCMFETELEAFQYVNELTREYSAHLKQYFEGQA